MVFRRQNYPPHAPKPPGVAAGSHTDRNAAGNLLFGNCLGQPFCRPAGGLEISWGACLPHHIHMGRGQQARDGVLGGDARRQEGLLMLHFQPAPGRVFNSPVICIILACLFLLSFLGAFLEYWPNWIWVPPRLVIQIWDNDKFLWMTTWVRLTCGYFLSKILYLKLVKPTRTWESVI